MTIYNLPNGTTIDIPNVPLPSEGCGVSLQQFLKHTHTGIGGDAPPIVFTDISVKNYGAKCDGVTDDTNSINNAISANTNSRIIINGNTKITSPIIMKSNVELVCTGTIDATGVDSAIKFEGNSILTSNLSGKINKNDTVISVVDATNINTKDYIIIEDNSFPNLSGTYAGINSVLVMVVSKAGNNLTINLPSPCDFLVATSSIRKVNLIQNSKATVGKIIGSPVNAFNFKWAKNCRCSGEVNPVGKNAVIFISSFENTAENIVGLNPTNTSAGWGYGCLFDFGSSDNILRNSYFENIREIANAFNARRNKVINNLVISPVSDGGNTHGLGSEDALFEGNTVINSNQYGFAIGLKSPSGYSKDYRTIIRNNTIINSAYTAIREEQYSSNIESNSLIEGNVIINAGLSNVANYNYGIAILGDSGTSNIVNTIIRNNRLYNTAGVGIYINNVSSRRCIISDNEINSTGKSGIRFDGTGGDNYCRNNIIRYATEYGIQSTMERNLVYNNIVESSTLANYYGIFGGSPTAGSWHVDDYIEIHPKSANSYSEYVCISAGSPGGWRGRNMIQA